jgi:hypothetical protein
VRAGLRDDARADRLTPVVDVRREDLETSAGGRADTPTNWELLRRLDRFETNIVDRLDSIYGRDYIDAQYRELSGRIIGVETQLLSAATTTATMRNTVLAATIASALAFVGNVVLTLIH